MCRIPLSKPIQDLSAEAKLELLHSLHYLTSGTVLRNLKNMTAAKASSKSSYSMSLR